MANNGIGSHDTSPNELRYADVNLFLTIYKHIANSNGKVFHNLKSLIVESLDSEDNKTGISNYTTALEQLKRFAKYFLNVDERDNGGTSFLFTHDDTVGVKPTRQSDILARRVLAFKEHYDNLKPLLRSELGLDRKQSIIRIGTPQTIGLRLLPIMFRNWKDLFGDQTELSVEIGNTNDLIPHLQSGSLDLVFSYGTANTQSNDQHNISYFKSNYDMGMVLLCHPNEALYLNSGKNMNIIDGTSLRYYDALFYNSVEKREIRPSYEDLWDIDLESLDTERNRRFFIVPSYSQPSRIREFENAMRINSGKIRYLGYYEEALSLVRMQQGIAITSEVYSVRHGTTAFRLSPESEYRRSLGVYYNLYSMLTIDTVKIIAFICEYLNAFKIDMRQGYPPSSGTIEYEKFCSRFSENIKNNDWLQRLYLSKLRSIDVKDVMQKQ